MIWMYFLCRKRHQSEGLHNFAVGEQIQERRLPQGNGERCFEGVIEYRIACAVGKIGDNNSVLVGQALVLMRPIVKAACDEYDEQDRSRDFPDLPKGSRRGF